MASAELVYYSDTASGWEALTSAPIHRNGRWLCKSRSAIVR